MLWLSGIGDKVISLMMHIELVVVACVEGC